MRSNEHYYMSLLSLYNFIYYSRFLFALPVKVSFAFLVAKFARTHFSSGWWKLVLCTAYDGIRGSPSL